MFQTCGACGTEITDEHDITTVSDGSVMSDGEIDWAQTEYYHSNCVSVSDRPNKQCGICAAHGHTSDEHKE